MRSHLGATQVSRGLALLCIISTNIYLGFDTTPVSSGAVPDTLIPRVEGTKTLTVGRTGKRLIIPFRGVIYSHIKRDTATFGANRGWFFHPPLPGGLGQKLQLRLIAWCNSFKVSGHYLDIYLTWINTLPAFSRLSFLPKEIWTHIYSKRAPFNIRIYICHIIKHEKAGGVPIHGPWECAGVRGITRTPARFRKYITLCEGKYFTLLTKNVRRVIFKS